MSGLSGYYGGRKGRQYANMRGSQEGLHMKAFSLQLRDLIH